MAEIRLRTAEERHGLTVVRLAEQVMEAAAAEATEIEVRKHFSYEGTLHDPSLYPIVAERLAEKGLTIAVHRLRVRRTLTGAVRDLSRPDTFDLISIGADPDDLPERASRPDVESVSRIYPPEKLAKP